MNAFMSTFIKMSLRGVVIVLVVLLVRLFLKKLRISHKYILGLWAMAFLYFIFPWKLSLSVGFWNNAIITEEMRVISELRLAAGERDGEARYTGNIANPVGIADNTFVTAPAVTQKDAAGTVAAIPVESTGHNIAGINDIKDNSPAKFDIGSVIEFIWLVGLSTLFGHMLYSYFALKRKLRLSILFEENIWWAENIDVPMVFGLIHAQIYLPVSMESEELSYVIAHEKMHVKRKDGLFKMFAYVVCLIHWFNPFIWIAYFLFGSDMEKACDEEVIRSMGREKRKEYAYALLHIAANNGLRKKRIFVAPVCFDEGNVKSRIRNIMKYKYTLPGIGIAVVIVIVALSVMFMTETKVGNVGQNINIDESGDESAAVYSDEVKAAILSNNRLGFGTGIVNTDTLNVRSEADADAEIISLLKRGAVIKIIAEENDFYQIIVEDPDDNDNLTGYVKKEYVDSVGIDILEVSDLNQNSDASGVIYNAVKYYNGNFYYSDTDGFKRMDKGMSTIETLAEGNVKVGNCEDNYIYYMRYPADDERNAGVFRMNLADPVEEQLLAWSEDMWMIQDIYAFQNIIYLEKYNICEAYEVNAGQISKIDEKDNMVYQNMDHCNILYEDINNLAYGYTSIMFQYHKFVYEDRNNNKVIVYDTDSGETVNIIEQCEIGILVCDRGIVYRDPDYNIWLREWENENSTLLYDMAANDNKFVQYGTYDNQYIYGFYEDDNECTLVKLMWDGGYKIGRVFENVSKAVELRFSANNGVISFLQDGHVVFEPNEQSTQYSLDDIQNVNTTDADKAAMYYSYLEKTMAENITDIDGIVECEMKINYSDGEVDSVDVSIVTETGENSFSETDILSYISKALGISVEDISLSFS